jgi:hypothetical protein
MVLPMWKRSLRLLCLAVLPLAVSPSAQAIPEAEALEKLSVIPVHLVVDAKGVPVPIPRKQSLLLPLYLERERAVVELARIRDRSPSLGLALATMPLSEANRLLSSLQKDLKPGLSLTAPVVPRRQDLEKGAALLKEKGLSEPQIRKGLTVPVFYTRPFLTISTPQGERGLLFLSHADLQRALAGQSNPTARRVEVSDITAVLRKLMQAPQDLFVFVPPQSDASAPPRAASPLKRPASAPPPLPSP